MTTIYVSDELHKRMKRLALEADVDLNDFTDALVAHALDDEELVEDVLDEFEDEEEEAEGTEAES